MKRHNPRARRVAEQIQRELMDLLRFEVKDPRVGMVTITSVDVTADLAHANILFTHLGGGAHADEATTGLAHASGHLRTELSRRLSLYSVPQLHFKYDDSIESGMRLSNLIDEAVASDKKPPL
ncbi:MAG: 30S ribosome-binding factor RbfA [Betaproteobacteria bacterium]